MPGPPSPYIWLPDLQRYRDVNTGRFASSEEVRGWGQGSMDDSADHARGMAGALAERDIALGQWERNMREQIKEEYVRQYLLGRGGRALMTAEDWGSIGGSLAEQYSWLNKFSAQIATGELSEKQIAARSEMYLHSAREAFERARRRAQGAPELPAYPGDGSTICLCITTPLSQVLTKRGWIPLLDVKVGDFVFTHRHRWRPVKGLVVKPSLPECKHAMVKAPTGHQVGCTVDHLWYTTNGWQNSTDIDSLSIPMYHTSILTGGMKYVKENMQDVWSPSVKSQQAQPVQILSVGMCLREAQGLSSGTMQSMCIQQEGQRAMERQARVPDDRSQRSRETKTHTLRGFGKKNLAETGGRTPLELVLARRRGHKKDTLPLPMELDHGEWPNSRGICDSSQGRQSIQRHAGEFETGTEWRPREAPWTNCSHGGNGQDARVDMPKPELREEIQAVSAWQEWGAEILFTGVLPPSTALYDLVVEEDSSFVIEGLIAHNTNCRCFWELEKRPDRWLAYWRITAAENCATCVERAGEWAPFELLVG